MKIFLDTANIQEIEAAQYFGVIDGITTNPSIIAESGEKIENVIAKICSIVSGPVSAEVISTEYKDMIEEGTRLAKIAKNVCIKLPLTPSGIKAVKYFKEKEIMTNVTLCFSVTQALVAAKAGATFISPFIGRLDDLAYNGMDLVKDIRIVFDNYIELETEIIAASIRSPLHVAQCARLGTDIATMSPKTLKQLYKNPLTDIGIKKFLEDYAKTQTK